LVVHRDDAFTAPSARQYLLATPLPKRALHGILSPLFQEDREEGSNRVAAAQKMVTLSAIFMSVARVFRHPHRAMAGAFLARVLPATPARLS
jgi:hypothetical protein